MMKTKSEEVKNTLDISEETKAAMWQFFLKTSVPRLLEQKKKEQEESN